MLETLLAAGDLGAAPWASTPFWWHWGVRVYNCPVLMLLQKGAKVSARGETVGEPACCTPSLVAGGCLLRTFGGVLTGRRASGASHCGSHKAGVV